MRLLQLNSMADEHAVAALQSCCVSPRWVDQMLAARPYTSDEQVFELAERIWQELDESDYLAAFEGHPQIGDLSTLKEKFATTAASAGHEQSGMQVASDEVLTDMIALNKRYLDKFGFIFIVCATGKTAQQMLDMIRQRIQHDRATELAIAAAEQAKITRIRLEKLF